jgi:hypothetical protein
LKLDFDKTSEYSQEPENAIDKRELINAKTQIQIPEYNQVFQEKQGFLSNLSMLDLMFNEGPNSINYLKEV